MRTNLATMDFTKCSLKPLNRGLVVILVCSFLFTGTGWAQNHVDAKNDVSVTLQERVQFEKLMQEYETDKTRDGYEWPPIWDVPQENSPSAPHFIIVNLSANPRINEIPLNQGDFIGGFYTDDNGDLKCGGARAWNDTTNISIGLLKDDYDTPEKDGFSNGEQIYFKFFSWITFKDYDVDVILFEEGGVYNGTDIWGSFNISVVINIQALVDLDFYINADSNPICIGNQVYLSAVEFIGTGGPYTFDWSSDPLGFFSNLQNPPPTTPNETTSFFLSVSDGVLTSEHQMTIVVNDLPVANAGPDSTICANEDFYLNGNASNYENTIWSSSGDGTFGDPTSFTTFYTPGEIDAQNGSATITLHANPLSPCVVNAIDELELSVTPLPFVNAGEDMTACSNDVVILEAEAENYSTILWTTSGSGTFTTPNSLVTQYIPSNDDINDGEVSLTVCVEATTPCIATACDNTVVLFLFGPSCNAPSSRTKCENVPVPMAGTASINNGILWTTQGDGYFIDSLLINTDYIPGPDDIANGGTTVTLNALPIDPCSTPATKDVLIIIKPMPEVDAGDDITTCTNVELSGAAADFSLFIWTSQGDGYFSNPSILNPVYFPGEQDISMQLVDLTLTAQPIAPCNVAAVDTLTLSINVPKIVADNVTDKALGFGDSLVFEFAAQSVIPGNYYWYFNGELLDGMNSSNLTIDTLSPDKVGYYQAMYANDCDELKSDSAFVEIHENFIHQNMLPQGWCGISSFVVPNDPGIEDIFSDIIDDLILIMDNEGHIYWPDQNINTMNDWSVRAGYKIKMENSAALNIDGLIMYPIQDLIIPHGWSYLPVNTTCDVDVEEIFTQFPDITVIKEMAGTGIYWPGSNINTLQVLYPGKAYHILNSGDPIILRYPACDPPEMDFKED